MKKGYDMLYLTSCTVSANRPHKQKKKPDKKYPTPDNNE
jgi:hypothetical protein